MSARLEYVDLEELRPADRNPQGHDIPRIQESIRRHGFVAPLILNEATGKLVAGHGRLEALLEMRDAGEEPPDRIDTGGKDSTRWKVPVVTGIAFASEADAEAYLMADNRLVELGGVDEETLLAMLRDAGDLTGTGYGDQDIAALERALLGRPDDPDAIPEAPKEPRSRPGDLWILGAHRILVGDATSPEAVDKLMAGEEAGLCFTDPPYGIAYRSETLGDMTGDDLPRAEHVELLTGSLREAIRITAPAAAFYVWHHSSTRHRFEEAFEALGLAEWAYLIWAKPAMGLGAGDYRSAHEPCYYLGKEGERPAFYGDRAEPTVWRIARSDDETTAAALGPGVVVHDGTDEIFISPRIPKRRLRRIGLAGERTLELVDEHGEGTVWEVSRESGLHPTQKAVDLAVRAIRNSSRRGEVVYDPFLGSGTTVIGAELTRRRCYGLEIDPRFADVVVRRWETFTGKRATLARAAAAAKP